MKKPQCGIRGYCGLTKRRETMRFCAQRLVVNRRGKNYCYYHDPENPKKFGEGYPPLSENMK